MLKENLLIRQGATIATLRLTLPADPPFRTPGSAFMLAFIKRETRAIRIYKCWLAL
jgi:hypothetical protein